MRILFFIFLKKNLSDHKTDDKTRESGASITLLEVVWGRHGAVVLAARRNDVTIMKIKPHR